MVLKVQANAIRQENIIKGIWIKRKRKKIPPTEKYAEHVKPQKPYNKQAHLTVLQDI